MKILKNQYSKKFFNFIKVDCRIEAFLQENGFKRQEMIETIYEQDEKLRRFEEQIVTLNRKLSLREDKISRQDDLVSRLSTNKKTKFVRIINLC